MTGLPVEARFENHKRGHKDSAVVRKYPLASALLRAPEPDESAQCGLNGEKLTADLLSHGTQSLGDVEECIVASLHSETEIREREGNGAGGASLATDAHHFLRGL
jgi:hypothetical protein